MNILLVEDDLDLGRALQLVLHSDGHRVTWVRLARDVDACLEPAGCDAILLDLSLPDGDGVDLLAALRAQGRRIPVLIISARDGLDQRLAGFASGADDYLIKPFDIPELLARLQAVVRRSAGDRQLNKGIWTVCDLVLDERGQSLTRAGQALALSKTEFGLLLALMKHAGQVVTRADLEDTVLPSGESLTLDSHMSNLRKKIGDGYVRTVRGVGYIVHHADQ